jgi:hypothetical protein
MQECKSTKSIESTENAKAQKHKAHKKKSNLHKTVSKPLHYIAQFNKDYSASQVISELLLQTE